MSLGSSEAAGAAKRSMARAAALVRLDLNRGVWHLAAIAATAVFFGTLGTFIGILSSFKGLSGDGSHYRACLLLSLAESLTPFALGLLVAIPPFAAYHSFREAADAFGIEMESAALVIDGIRHT